VITGLLLNHNRFPGLPFNISIVQKFDPFQKPLKLSNNNEVKVWMHLNIYRAVLAKKHSRSQANKKSYIPWSYNELLQTIPRWRS